MSLTQRERPPGWTHVLVVLVVAGDLLCKNTDSIINDSVSNTPHTITGITGRVCAHRGLLQSSTAPTYCLYEDTFATWTTNNCFRVCLQATMGGNLNFYDFAWNFTTALTDLTFLNPGAAQQVQLNKNTQMLAACYNKPLPSKALGMGHALFVSLPVSR